MLTRPHIALLGRYNSWQNRSIYGAAATLDDAARKQDRGAHFRSIHGTLNHLLWGDQTWLSRFAGTAKPAAKSIAESPDTFDDWDDLAAARTTFDQTIEHWSASVSEDWLGRDLSWFSGAAGRDVTKPAWFCVAHFFNHQTHHRGQVHAMLTAAGAKPDDTDLFYLDL
ncbi:MAG: DinB family protein, partial [Pseudomonadota bacterium]